MGDTKRVLPASPNWFSSSVCDVDTTTGVAAYGAGQRVCLLDVNSANCPAVLDHITPVHTGRQSRVVSVKLSRNEAKPICAIGSSNGTLSLWHTSTLQQLSSHSKHQGDVSCISWSAKIDSLIISGDNKGNIVAFKSATNDTKIFTPSHDAIISIACSKHNQDIVAVGYKGGALSILNLSHTSSTCLQHRLQGHTQDVQSLSWCSEADHLVSGSCDRSIRVWDVGNKGKMVHTLLVPTGKGTGGRSRDKLWITVYWLSKETIISSGEGGTLLKWNLGTTPCASKSFTSRGHSHVVFAITPIDRNNQKLLTVSSNRQIVAWDVASMKAVWCLPSIGGHIYSISVSPVDPSRIALGCGDNLLRIWNTENRKNNYDCKGIWKGIQCRVRTVLWHPTDDVHLAVGLEDGTVMVYDTVDQKPNRASTYHTGAVTSLSWRHAKGESPDDPCELYSCGEDGKVFIHSGLSGSLSSRLFEGAEPGSDLKEEEGGVELKICKRTCIHWRNEDINYLAVGQSDGIVKVYSDNAECLLSVVAHKRSVGTLQWKGGNDTILATTAGGNVNIYNLTAKLQKGSTEPIYDASLVLRGHDQPVTQIRWSPSNNQQIASASLDNSVQIWNAVTGAPMANYRGHGARVLSLEWSLLEPNTLISGSSDQSVCIWGITAATHEVPPEGKKKKGKGPTATTTSQRPAKITSGDTNSSHASSTDTHAPKKRKEKKLKSILPLCNLPKQQTVSENQSSCVSLGKMLRGDQAQPVEAGFGERHDLCLFQDRRSVFRVIAEEASNHSISGHISQRVSLMLWNGNIIKALNLAIDEDCLDASMVALAPAAGYDVWERVSQAFAHQLSKQGEYHQAVNYFLATGKVREAVRTYITGQLWSEAVALAKARLLPTDPLITAIFEMWATFSEEHSNYEQAAKCYLALSKPEAAARLLSRRGGGDSLKCAVEIGRMFQATPQGLLARYIWTLRMRKEYPECKNYAKHLNKHGRMYYRLLSFEAVLDAQCVTCQGQRLPKERAIQKISSACSIDFTKVNVGKEIADVKQAIDEYECEIYKAVPRDIAVVHSYLSLLYAANNQDSNAKTHLVAALSNTLKYSMNRDDDGDDDIETETLFWKISELHQLIDWVPEEITTTLVNGIAWKDMDSFTFKLPEECTTLSQEDSDLLLFSTYYHMYSHWWHDTPNAQSWKELLCWCKVTLALLRTKAQEVNELDGWPKRIQRECLLIPLYASQFVIGGNPDQEIVGLAQPLLDHLAKISPGDKSARILQKRFDARRHETD